MAKDVLITPANGVIEFKDASGNLDASITLDDNGNLNIANSGSISVGDTSSNVYIGDGVNSVDVVFEQSGAVRALAGKTLTIGQSDGYVSIAAPMSSTALVTNLNADLLDGQQGSYYAADSNVVKLSGDQTIAGIKTFSNGLVASADIKIGSVSSDNYGRVRFASPDSYGIASEFGNLLVITNEQGSTNQGIILGDTGASSSASLFTVITGTGNTPTTGDEGTWNTRLNLTGAGDLSVTGSVSGQTLISIANTGTAPFTVSSTTVVTNLNADLLDGQQGSYYLDWTNVTNKPDPTVTVTLTGDVTGTANTTLTDLSSGTVSVATTLGGLDASKITSGTIDAARLPSFVDDVLEYTNLASFPATGESGKIYVALDTNKTYRWSGSSYVYITSGAVDSVAGKTGVVTLVKGDVGLGSVDNTADSSKNVLSASKLTTTRTISLTGDVTGSVSFDGSANASITTTIAANSVALGTDTTGNYMVNVSAGGGITVSHTQGEGSTATVSHADTSSATNLTANGRTYVTGLTFDTYGHVTGYTTGVETVVDTDTTYTAGTGLDLTGTTFSLEDTAVTPGSYTAANITVDAQGRITAASTTNTSSYVTLTGTQTLTNKTVEKLVLNNGYTEKVFTITDGSTVNLDPNNGSIQTWVLGANRTPGQVNWASGQSITLLVDDGSASTITWTTLAPVWKTDSGSAPTLNTTGYTVVVLWKVGTTIYGARIGDA